MQAQLPSLELIRTERHSDLFHAIIIRVLEIVNESPYVVWNFHYAFKSRNVATRPASQVKFRKEPNRPKILSFFTFRVFKQACF